MTPRLRLPLQGVRALRERLSGQSVCQGRGLDLQLRTQPLHRLRAHRERQGAQRFTAGDTVINQLQAHVGF